MIPLPKFLYQPSIWMINISFFLIKKNIGRITHHSILRDGPHIVIIIIVPLVINWMPTYTRIMTIIQLASMHHHSNQFIHVILPLFWSVNVFRYVEFVKRVWYLCGYFTILSKSFQNYCKYLTSWFNTTLSDSCCLLITTLTLPSFLFHDHLWLLKML